MRTRPSCGNRKGGWEGGEPLEDGYTDFGYRLNGIEYATDTEALDAEDDDQ